jgi:hypothetical protein
MLAGRFARIAKQRLQKGVIATLACKVVGRSDTATTTERPAPAAGLSFWARKAKALPPYEPTD